MKTAFRLLLLVVLLAVAPAAYSQTYTEGPWNYTVEYSNGKGEARIFGYSGAGGVVIIPSTLSGFPVTTVFGFASNASITNVVIPDSVRIIRNSAFQGCTGLTSVSIPSSVTSIGMNAFRGCTGLTSVNMDFGVKNIQMGAFQGCTKLKFLTIGTGVTSIGQSAFSGCTSLTSVTIPSGVTSIGMNAFRGCTGLTSANIPSSVTNIGAALFQDCTSLTSVTISSGVKVITDSTFQGCTSLTSVSIPTSATSIGDSAFKGCTGLTSVNIAGAGGSGSGVTSIGSSAFQGCTSLTSVNIPDSVTSIGGYTFQGCTSLTSVKIGSAVTSIGDYAFQGCTGLTSVNIPDSVTSIGSGLLQGCISLTGVNIPFSLTGVTIGSGVRSIGDNTFQGCSGLTSVDIPRGVTSIGVRAFQGCTSLTRVTSSVKSIGDYAFQGCTGLTSVSIPNSVTSIGWYAFQGSGLRAAYFAGDMPSGGGAIFADITPVGTVYYPSGNTTWGASFYGWPTQPNVLPRPPQPVLAVEQPVGVKLVSGANAVPFPTSLIGITSPTRIYTLRNTGNAVLSNVVVTKSGPSSAEFSLTPLASNSLAAGASTTFSVAFLPASSGARTAQVSITSNDTNNSPFLINLSGTAVSANVDTDGDGLNDAAELTMSALGFDWQNSQPALVDALMSNANQANLFTKTQFDANRTNGRGDVTGNPSAYNLFTATQYLLNASRNRSQGQLSVTTNPAAWNLVSRTNIPPVHLAVPMNAAFTLSLGGTWTRYGLTGIDNAWTFNTNTGELKGTLVGTNERTLRLIPYNGSQAGPEMTIQLRPAP